MGLILDAEEIRILGSLLEKEITTPEYYPLSLNGLLNACNQKSNRDPVLRLDEDTLERAFYTLRDKGLLVSITGAGSRVPKYGHRISEKFNLGRRELAIICELMLRGPQTLGELRTRAERMHHFDEVSEVESVLERMPELVTKLPRRPGEKEARYAHLLAGEPLVSADPPASDATPSEPAPPPAQTTRMGALEAEIAQLRGDLEDLKQQFARFQKQFE
jgi:uncharacterized protein YceH (UPF0502 family)